MFSMKNAALVGLASADRTLFAPVASPYGQVTTAYEPAIAGAYPMSADAMVPVQPVEFVQAEPQGSDSTWLFAGVGALALVGAYASRSAAPSSVATLDEEDLESARIATLGVGGAGLNNPLGQEKLSEKNKGTGIFGGWSLTGFLMQGRRGGAAGNDGTFGELEYLSGAARPAADNSKVLNNRFKILYDERSRKVVKAKRDTSEKVTGAWRSKNPSTFLYGEGAGGNARRARRGLK